MPGPSHLLEQPHSPETRQLVLRLERLPGPARWLLPGPDRSDLFERIATCGEPGAIPYLLPWVLERPVASGAATAVRQLLEAVPPPDWVHLETRARGLLSSWDNRFQRWSDLKPKDLPRLGELPDGWAVLGMATFHPNGYVREAAVRHLAAGGSDRTLPFLLLRLNDWVGAVRDAAETAMASMLTTSDRQAWVDALPLLLRMRSWRRDNHDLFVDTVLRLLQQPGSLPALIRGMDAVDPVVRRECFRIAFSMVASDLPRYVERALADFDPQVRTVAVQQLPHLAEDPLRHLIAIACADRFPSVRREAMQIYGTRFPEEALPVLQRSLLDPHASIRELAARCLVRLDQSFDPADFYRGALLTLTGRPLRSAISSLSTVGTAADAVLLLPFCSHPLVKVREAAVRSIGRLDAGGHAEIIHAALADRSPRVSREARRILAAGRRLIVINTVWEYARREEQPRHVRRNALALLADLPKWVSLPFLLQLACLAGPEIASTARADLSRWVFQYNCDFLKPSSQQLQAIEEAIAKGGDALEPGSHHFIRTAVNTWRASE